MIRHGVEWKLICLYPVRFASPEGSHPPNSAAVAACVHVAIVQQQQQSARLVLFLIAAPNEKKRRANMLRMVAGHIQSPIKTKLNPTQTNQYKPSHTMSTAGASPRPVPVISTGVNTSAGIQGDVSKGDKSGAVDIPIAKFVPEEEIDNSASVFPHKILRLLLICDGVTAYAQILRFLFVFMAEFDDWPAPVIILSSLTSIVSLVLACSMHRKTSIAEDRPSTNRIKGIHIAICIMETIIALVLFAFVVMGSASIAFVLMMPVLTISTIFVFPFVAFGLNMKCYMLETRLQDKIKSADNAVSEAVESSAAQSLIEKDGIEIV